MLVLSIVVLASASVASDGLPLGSQTEATARLNVWDACLKKAIKNPAELTNDPSDVVVQIALTNCDTEFSNAKFAWRRMLVAESSFKPTDAEAEKMAEESFEKFSESRRNNLLTSVSYIRQMQTLDKMREDLRKKLP
jgi:hypothetical protein